MVASLLTHRENHFSDPLGRIWREHPFISKDSGGIMEVMILIGCGLTHRDIALGHHIQECVGASRVEQWSTSGHGDAWWCVVECQFALWSRRSDSHRIEYTQGVSSTVTQ